MAWHADVIFSEALDNSHDTPEQHYWAKLLVPAAATWFIQAATKIYDMCQDSNGVRSLLRTYSWSYSFERWAFWKCRVLEIAANEALKISISDMASRAAFVMDKVDSGVRCNHDCQHTGIKT